MAPPTPAGASSRAEYRTPIPTTRPFASSRTIRRTDSVLTDGFLTDRRGGAAMRRDWNQLFRTIVPAGALGVAAFTLSSQQAAAFFPPVRTPVHGVTVVPPPPPIVVPPVIPPVPPPPFVPPPPPPESPPPVPPAVPPPVVVPVTTPEPGTLTTGLIGIAVAGGWVLRKRRKAGPSGD
jgi:hypothetical protein